jgi:hypothetical protein
VARPGIPVERPEIGDQRGPGGFRSRITYYSVNPSGVNPHTSFS